MKLVECVPNFSEGRDQKILNAIADSIRAVKDVSLLDVDPGSDTNRTVFTIVGEPDAVVEAAFQAMKTAANLIDMSKHTGAHPRMGATDVCPFIPISEMTMEDCVALAHKLGKKAGEELGIPIYMYEYAATKPEWKNLAEVRKGEYEALSDKAKDPYWKPDYGPHTFNSRSGATAVSAREFLIAYNINLNTRDEKKATELAQMIRESGYPKRDKQGTLIKDKSGNKITIPGLFSYCKAVGWYIDAYKKAQISINLTNYKVTPPHIVLEKVRELALKKGIIVTGSEVVGLIPKEAMLNAGKYYLQQMNESTGIPERMIIETAVQSMGLAEVGSFELDKKIIEYAITKADNLVNMTITDFADLLSTDAPAPGGGSVAALCASISGALSSMVANLTVNKKGYEKVQKKVFEIADLGQSIKERAIQAIDKDTQAFNEMMSAMKLPKKTQEEKDYRQMQIQNATMKAILVPLEVLRIAHEAVELSGRIALIGNTNALSDAATGAVTANAAAKAAYYNVRINLHGIDDKTSANKIMVEADQILKAVNRKAINVEKQVMKKL
ncbi:MAG TPA: glutamate formimidoyltransferase [Candidatus Cloacimonadota bacterium]|nr:glutamate formimidoyltransferase [Candidatus Cloacimonadota bacterium]HPT71256.1 glutamate formimidoyltransferase [Candidatus Cloacimonadota bacterium]